MTLYAALVVVVSYSWGADLSVTAGPVVGAARSYLEYTELAPCDVTLDTQGELEAVSELRVNRSLIERTQ